MQQMQRRARNSRALVEMPSNSYEETTALWKRQRRLGHPLPRSREISSVCQSNLALRRAPQQQQQLQQCAVYKLCSEKNQSRDSNAAISLVKCNYVCLRFETLARKAEFAKRKKVVYFCSANFRPENCKLIIFSKQFQNGIFRTGLFWG